MFTIPQFYSPVAPLVCWSDAFTDNELDQLIEFGDKQQFMQAKVGNTEPLGSVDVSVRQSQVSWIYPNQDINWLFTKMAELISVINNQKFQFELENLPSFQYTTYTTGGFYNWHIDSEQKPVYGPWHRKLGVSVLLSDPDTDFTGGEFQIIPGGNPSNIDIAKCKKGDVLVFPSYIPHRVTEVLSGKRKSLVTWITGPKFK
jgi:PKHD-type hydroxylase